MMSTLTTPQLSMIGTLCSKLKYSPDVKQAMVSSYSNGRTTSSKGLTFEEASDMIKYLKSFEPVDPARAKMVGKILGYAREMKWTKVNSQNKVVADVFKVDQWMEKYSYLKKKLDNYETKELPKLVSQFEMVYKHFLKSI